MLSQAFQASRREFMSDSAKACALAAATVAAPGAFAAQLSAAPIIGVRDRR